MSYTARASSFNPRMALAAAAVCASGMFNSHDASAALPPLGSTTPWQATLPPLPPGATSYKISVAVYNAQGVLVRTLVRGADVTRPSTGQIRGVWDGRNDAGVAVATGPANRYTIRLAYHNIRYTWEGVIGNTSSSFNTGVHSNLHPVNGLAIAGSNAYIAAGYNEGQPGLSGFLLSAPNTALRQFPSTDTFVSYAMVAADASKLYVANTGGGTHTTFVRAFNRLAPFSAVNFSSGQSVCLNYRPSGECYPDQSYSGVIDVYGGSSSADHTQKSPTGIAVQQSGNVLAVAHGGLNLVRLFDKTTGALLGSISVPMSGNASKLNQISMTAAGDLWVISGNTVRRYTNLSGTPSQAAVISSDLVSPLALSAEGSGADTGGVWVADGGTSQQIKRFTASGTAGSSMGDTKGIAGGYASDPAVSEAKLCFKVAGGERTALAAEPDGSLWATDTCNNRLLRFAPGASTAGTTSASKVSYLPVVYTSAVDHGNPSCVYANFLQFCHSGAGDRTDALVAGGDRWPLVKNWLPSLPADVADSSRDNSGFGGFTTVQTLGGRTYGLITVSGVQKVVELPSSGPARLISDLPQVANTTTTVMYENGDLGYATLAAVGSTQTVYRRPFTDIVSGNPQWSAAVIEAVVPTTAVSAYFRAGVFTGAVGPRFPKISSNRVVFFDQSVTGTNFHLGLADSYASSPTGNWLWLASPSGALDGRGSFQTKAYDNNSVNYGGSSVWASGSNVVYGYQGTNFKDLNGRLGYASQFMHFDVYGLFLGQFGESDTRSTREVGAKLPLNPLSQTLVQEASGGPLFLYTSDESGHGGVHRFRFNDLSTLGYRRSGQFTFGATVSLTFTTP